VIATAKQVRADLDAIVDGSSGLDAAATELITALNAVESSERPAPSQALAVFELARAGSRANLKQWAALKSGAISSLSAELKSQGLSPISIP
jgi:hypothetical protein